VVFDAIILIIDVAGERVTTLWMSWVELGLVVVRIGQT
jgi:hypothetical protein